MRKRRYEILLPVRHNDGRLVSWDLLEQTREELVARFHGLPWPANLPQDLGSGRDALRGRNAPVYGGR